jgi:hypothetical protein
MVIKMEQNNEIEIALLVNMQLIAEYSNDVINDMNSITLEIQQFI